MTSTVTQSPGAVEGTEEVRPAEVHHYETVDEVPASIQKYWHQRHSIFSRWDAGIWLTDAAWYGVTPEPVATRIAADMASSIPTASSTTTTLIDLFAGAGGNAIAFALSGRWTRIFAIEKDAATLACARHNARVYGVEKRIWFILGDCFEVLRSRLKAPLREGATVFGSPPWGGPGYRDAGSVFGLADMEPYGLRELMGTRPRGGRLVLFLPRSSDLNEIASEWERIKREEGGEGLQERCRVTHYCMFGASKALCVYFGAFDFSRQEQEG